MFGSWPGLGLRTSAASVCCVHACVCVCVLCARMCVCVCVCVCACVCVCVIRKTKVVPCVQQVQTVASALA